MKKKVKILHIFGRMDKGGAETLVMNLLRKIDKNVFQFDFLVHTDKECHYDKEIFELGGRIFSVKSSNRDFFNYKKEVKNIIKNNGPYDVIHSHIYNFSGVFMKIANELNVPIRISHSHTIANKNKSNFIRRFYITYMRKLILSNSTDLIGCSLEACGSLFGANYSNDNRVKVFQNAIDVDSYSPSKLKNYSLRKELGLDEGVELFGHVGNFRIEKNHSYLLKIFNAYQEKVNRNAHLVLVGDGPLKSQILKTVNEYNLSDKVHMLGVRNDVPQIMKNLNLFVFPSSIEGLGIAAIEAQAAGIGCVISDSVPKEVDLDLGLVNFVSLNKDETTWVNIIQKQLKIDKPDWKVIKQKVDKLGYNINNQVKEIESIYTL